MSGRFFLDSNIIIYSLDSRVPKKQLAAESLMESALAELNGCISTQVVQECLHLMTSKFKHLMAPDDLKEYMDNVLTPLAAPLPLLPLYRDALGIQQRWKFGFYDALIVAAALALECDTIYSEDLQHGQQIEDVTIVNPFEGS